MSNKIMQQKEQRREKELFHAYLHQNGLKKTHQKELILEIFLDTEGHVSVDDLYARVRRRDSNIGVVTVFRTMKSFLACGIAREINLGDGVTRYEHSFLHPHHHHIICTECGKTIEFMSPELEQLQDAVVRRYRFQPAQHRLEIYGKCEECGEMKPPTSAPDFGPESIFARDALRMAIQMERRGITFYQDAAARNIDVSGSRAFEHLASEEEIHLRTLLDELNELERREPGIEEAPQFLHFNSGELDSLIPTLREFESGDELRLSVREALEISLEMGGRWARFFNQYAEIFMDTRGKKVFEQFAEEQSRHYRAIRDRLHGEFGV